MFQSISCMLIKCEISKIVACDSCYKTVNYEKTTISHPLDSEPGLDQIM